MLRFHLASGARLAQRAFVPVAGTLVVAVGLTQDPAATTRAIAAAVAAPRLSGAVIVALLAAGGAIASWAAPRLAFSTSGWIRHLPASAVAHRRAAALALAAAQLPLLVGVAGLVALAAASGAPVGATRLPAVAAAALGIGTAFAPTRRRAAALVLGSAASVAALALGTAGLVVAALLLAVSDRLGGAPAAKPSPLRVPAATRLPLAEAVALRVAAPALPAALLLAAVPLAAGYALVRNNPDLPPLLGTRGARLAGAMAIAVVVARAADRLTRLRPPWPWSRSLPWSSRRRVLADVVVLAGLAAPCVLASALLHGAAVGAVAGAAVPLVAARGAAAIRRGHDAASPPSGAILAESAFVAALLALVPWLGLAALAAIPWAVADAARRERELRVSRWAALHHLAAGDPLSWRTR
jgi:hypothetical protein